MHTEISSSLVNFANDTGNLELAYGIRNRVGNQTGIRSTFNLSRLNLSAPTCHVEYNNKSKQVIVCLLRFVRLHSISMSIELF